MLDAVAIKVNLIHRGCGSDDLCRRCNTEQETLEHMLFLCEQSKHIWHASYLSYLPRESGFQTFKDWWLETKKMFDRVNNSEMMNLVAITCWNIWMTRNAD